MKSYLKISKQLLFASSMLLAIGATAQEENKTTVKGFVDGYFKLDASRKNDQSRTLYTESHNSFELGSANVQVGHNSGKAKFFGDFGFGKRINDLNSLDGNSTASIIKELYIDYELMSGLNVTFGTFQRHFGVEKINANENRNYSMSHMYSNSPLLNTGLKINYKIDGFNVMVGAGNPADFKSAIAANTTQKTVLAQVGYTLEATNISLNYQSSSHNPSNKLMLNGLNLINYTLVNGTLKHKFDDKLSVAGEANFAQLTRDNTKGKETIASVAGYVTYSVKENLGLSYRGEYFVNDGNASGMDIIDAKILSNTVSANYKLGNLTIIPEFRADFADKRIYTLNKKTSQINTFFLVSAIYSF